MWNADWVKVPVVETMQRVICATTNRVFVGTPLCARNLSAPSIQSISYQSQIGRDPDYQSLNVNFAVNVVKFGTIISMFPKPLKPYVTMSYHEPVSLSCSQTRCTRDI
jgi:hypothetical protein